MLGEHAVCFVLLLWHEWIRLCCKKLGQSGTVVGVLGRPLQFGISSSSGESCRLLIYLLGVVICGRQTGKIWSYVSSCSCWVLAYVSLSGAIATFPVNRCEAFHEVTCVDCVSILWHSKSGFACAVERCAEETILTARFWISKIVFVCVRWPHVSIPYIMRSCYM